MHLAIEDKIYRNCLLKCCTWTRVHERQTKVGESWSQMVEDNVNTKPEKQQFNTQFVITEGYRGGYVSPYTRDQEHTRSITTTFIFFALRLLAQPSKFISNFQHFPFKNFTNLMLYWKSMYHTSRETFNKTRGCKLYLFSMFGKLLKFLQKWILQ